MSLTEGTPRRTSSAETWRECSGLPRPPTSLWGRTDIVLAATIGLLLSVVFLATAATGPAQVNDTRAASIGAWTLATQGTVALPHGWPESRNYWAIEGRDGQVLVNRFPGVAYWATPAYMVAEIAGSQPVEHPLLVDPTPAAITAALTTAAAAVLLFVLLRGLVGRSAALVGTIVTATGTSLWSVAADAMWPHGPSTLALLAMLLAWRRARATAAGICALMAVLLRPHLVVVVFVLAVFAWRRERSRDAAALAGGALAGVAALSIYSTWAFGTLLPVAGYDPAGHLSGLVWHSPWQTTQDLALALVSPTRGLLIFSPVVIPALVALVRGWRQLPPWTLASAGAGMVYLFVQVRAVGYLGGDGFFAYRTTIEPLILATPALVLAAARSMRPRSWPTTAFVSLALVSIGLHAYGAIVGGITEQTSHTWEQVHDRILEEHSAVGPDEAEPSSLLDPTSDTSTQMSNAGSKRPGIANAGNAPSGLCTVTWLPEHGCWRHITSRGTPAANRRSIGDAGAVARPVSQVDGGWSRRDRLGLLRVGLRETL